MALSLSVIDQSPEATEPPGSPSQPSFWLGSYLLFLWSKRVEVVLPFALIMYVCSQSSNTKLSILFTGFGVVAFAYLVLLALKQLLDAVAGEDFKTKQDLAREVRLWRVVQAILIAATCAGTYFIVRMLQDLLNWAIAHEENFDPGLLLAGSLLVIAAFIAGLIWLIANLLGFDPETFEEPFWLFLTLMVAVAPGAMRASWGPNIIFGVIFPIVILHARRHYARFILQPKSSERE